MALKATTTPTAEVRDTVKEVIEDIQIIPVLNTTCIHSGRVVHLNQIVPAFLSILYASRNIVIPLPTQQSEIAVLHPIVPERSLDLLNGILPTGPTIIPRAISNIHLKLITNLGRLRN